MTSSRTTYRGRLESPRAQDRLVGALSLIHRILKPDLDVTFRRIDVTLDGPVLVLVPGPESDFVEIGDVRVVGAEITLTDGRKDCHRMPFTFVRSIGCNHLRLPELGGTLVTVMEREECRFHISPRIRRAPRFMAQFATQLLRHDLRDEFDLLMAYLRRFHMPSLYYSRFGSSWRDAPLPHFNEYRKWVGRLCRLPRQQRTVRRALGDWCRRTNWPWPSEMNVLESSPALFECEGTVEAIAMASLITVLCQAHSARPDARRPY